MGLDIGNFGKGLVNFAKGGISSLFEQTPKETNEILYLPINPLVKDYNIGKDLFKVKIKSKTNKPSKLDSDGNVIKDKNNAIPTFEMEILYNQPSLSVAHSFEWGNSMLGGAAEGINTVARGLKRGLSMKNEIATGGNVFNSLSAKPGGLDVAPVYKGSSKPSVTLNFILLAHTDPYLEVVLPAQILTYIAYPSITPGNLDALVKKLNGVSSNFVSSSDSMKGNSDIAKNALKDSADNPIVKGALEGMGATIDNVSKLFSDEGGKNWRYVTGEQPDFWEIETSNGIMNMKFAHISAMNITYHSPWVAPKNSYEGNYAKSLQFAGAVKSIVESGAQGGESGISSMVSSIFPNALDFGKSMVSKLGGGLPGEAGKFFEDFSGEVDYSFEGGFPSYAEVSMTFTSNYEKIFGEDWIADARPAPISVSKGQAANAIFGAANSIIKNTFKK
jgi:hypothetical protein